MSEPATCANCATPLAGEWCHACGQKRLRPEDRRLRAIAGEFVAAVTELDGRFLATLKGFLAGPGRMAADYLAGARRRYLSPVTLFLLANLVYFVAPPLTDFAPSLADHVTLQPYSGVAAAMVDARLADRDVSVEDYAKDFEARQDHLARSLIILHVPFLAAGLALLHFRRGRPFADHVLVALYAMAFVLAAMMTVPWILAGAAMLAGLGASAAGAVWRIGLLVIAGAWFSALLRGAYGQPGGLALAKVPAFLLAVGLSHILYRAAIFAIVFAST